METYLKNRKILTKSNLIILGIVLLAGFFSIASALTKEIIIRDGNEEIKVKGFFSNTEDVLRKGNVILEEHDQVSQPLGSKVKNGMEIVIKRAYPVTIQVDGKSIEVMTAYKRVKDILKEHHVSTGDMDKVEPGLDAVVAANGTIHVIRIKQEVVTEKAEIPYERIVKYNDSMDKGKMKVIQPGKKGEKEIKYKVVYENGKEVSREMIEEKVTVKAVNEVVEQGTAQYLATSRGNIRFKKVIRMTATAYDATYESTGKHPGDPYYGITRMGTKVRPGVVAVDPKVIPLGTRVYVKALDGSKDYGFARAEDTGGAIKGNKIDLYFEDPKDVKRYGKRKVEVYILE